MLVPHSACDRKGHGRAHCGMALAYMEASVMPSGMYAMEMVERNRASPVLHGAHHAVLVEATLCGILNEWWRGQPHVRKSALVGESKGVSWEVEWKKRTVALATRLLSVGGSLAGGVAAAKKQNGNNRVIRRAVEVSTAWGVPLTRGDTTSEKREWGKEVKESAVAETIANLRGSDDSALPGCRPSNVMYTKGSTGVLGEAEAMANVVPCPYDRVMLRRMKMGAIPHLKANEAKMSRKFDAVANATTQEALLQCGCGKGPQDA